jgi:hypothetical protein
MVKIAPPSARFQIVEEAGWFSVTVPVRSNWFVTFFVGFWLCGWAIGEVMVPVSFFRDTGEGPPGAVAFILVWLALWTVGGGAVLYIWLWNLVGEELVAVGQGSLVLRRNVLGLGRYREFDLAHVRDLRVPAQSYFPWMWLWTWWCAGFGGGNLAFDYGARTYRFASGLDEAEAKLLLDALRPHLPARVIAQSA